MNDGEECARCAQLYVEERLSCPAIGRRVGLHPVTVRQRLDAAGVRRRKGRSRQTDPATIAAIAALTAQGLAQREIAARLGVSHVPVGRWQPRLRVARDFTGRKSNEGD